jgi:hypothetical protein
VGFMEEVESGDRMRALVALRRELATAIDSGPPAKELAALALRLERVLDAIDAAGGIPTEEHDELAAKRRALLSAAAGA